MSARIWILLLPITAMGGVKSTECDQFPGAILQYERQVLAAKDARLMSESLNCILRAQAEADDGDTRYIAASSLRTLLGGQQIRGVIKDKRYSQIAKSLEKLTLQSKDPLYKSVVAEFAHGDWGFYKLFCEEGNTEFCPDFLPDEEKVKNESPLLAAASLLRLKNAYHALKGKEQLIVAERIKRLYKELPPEAKLQRKFIDQIYLELFGQQLGMA